MTKKKSKKRKARPTKSELDALRSQEIMDARHRPTPELRHEVITARLALMCDEDLAYSLGISVARLHECYRFELTRGPAEARRKLIAAMHGESLRGKPAAVKQLEAMTSAPLYTELSLSRETVEKLTKKMIGHQDLGEERPPPANPKYMSKKTRLKLASEEEMASDRMALLNDDEEEPSSGSRLQ